MVTHLWKNAIVVRRAVGIAVKRAVGIAFSEKIGFI
jgi:hypothetical protein